MPGRAPAQGGQPRQPFGPQLKAALVQAAPLFSAMAAGYSSGRGPYAYLDQGIAGMQDLQKQKRDEEAAAAAAAAFGGLVPGGMGPAGMSSKGGTSSGGGFAPVPIDPSSPDAIAADTMTALGRGNDWLKYSNQGATRNDPLDAKLVDAMSFLPQMGITMDVISGGQEAAGEGGARKGSVRHDHGMAADVDFYKDGRKLDWNNPADLPLLTQIVQTAKSQGVTGIGAGDDYMGAGRFHVGFGNPAVWGKGGQSANAPAWLVDAYNGAPSGSVTMSAKGEGSVSGVVDPLADPYVQRLMQVMAMPGLTPEQRSVVELQLQTRMGQLTATATPVELKTFTGPDGVVYKFNPVSGAAEPMTGAEQPARPMTPQERAQWGIPETDKTPYKMTDSGPVAIGGGGVTVNNEMGGGPSDDKLRGKLMEKEGELWSTYLQTGATSAGTVQDMAALDELIKVAPQGPVTGRLAEVFPGFSSAGDAFQSIVKRVAPTLRAPGSGATSDIEYDGMLRSLPALRNSPEANAAIAAMMKAKASLNVERARVIEEYQNGVIEAPEARKRMAELDKRSIMTPEVAAVLGIDAPTGDGAAPQAGGVPEGIDPEDWKYMTPEERAAFQ